MRVKYPRTYHLPWSLAIGSDDKIIESLNYFYGKDIVITEKRDGENTSLYSDGYIHARSIDSAANEWQSWVKNFWQNRYFYLPENYRICGENLYAKHSIEYELETYFEGFSIWQGDRCLDWDTTLGWFELLEIKPVPTIYRGSFDENLLKKLTKNIDIEKCEGYVIRVSDHFYMKDFHRAVAKFVRKDHVKTNDHWSRNWKSNKIVKQK